MDATPGRPPAPWWQRGGIYEVYPRSFQDADGDGVGDLRGIGERLDYLAWLGIDAIWIAPFYPSPMADFGYDVADYTAVDPRFGTLADFDRLVGEAHARGLRVIVDFVPNHTSDLHPWFVESRASRSDPKRDWYIWRDAAGGDGQRRPPNNWMSTFGGSAWTWDEATGQYYLHSFLPEQPDLNWRNPEVQEAMLDVLRFWLERGADGFRVDVIWHIVKDDEFRDDPPDPTWRPGDPDSRRFLRVHSSDRPEVHHMIERMRSVVDAYGDRVIIGETYLPIERLVAYYGERGEGVHMPFNFQLLLLPWETSAIARAIDEYERLLPDFAWPNWVLGNHDRPRVASRVGEEQARVAAMMLLTLRGTPTIYYGDEIGMTDVAIPAGRLRDPVAFRQPGHGLGRDPQRTPMQWSAGPGAGFTDGEPWLPIAPEADMRNVTLQRDDPASMLTLHRRLLALRHGPALASGRYASVVVEGDLFVYTRRAADEAYLVVLNLGGDVVEFRAPSPDLAGTVLLSTHLDREGERSDVLPLRSHEGVVVRL